jgi:hypothetical protein
MGFYPSVFNPIHRTQDNKQYDILVTNQVDTLVDIGTSPNQYKCSLNSYQSKVTGTVACKIPSHLQIYLSWIQNHNNIAVDDLCGLESFDVVIV